MLSNWNALLSNIMAAEDDVIDSWEDADTEELERRMEERQKQLIEEKKVPKIETTGTIAGNGLSLTAATQHDSHLPLRMQDSDRTEYVPPIKILRRQPEHPSGIEQAAAGTPSNTSKSTTKSLAEREAEYASARARILGSVYSPEENGTSRKVMVTRGSEAATETVLKRQPKGPDGTCGFQHLS